MNHREQGRLGEVWLTAVVHVAQNDLGDAGKEHAV